MYVLFVEPNCMFFNQINITACQSKCLSDKVSNNFYNDNELVHWLVNMVISVWMIALAHWTIKRKNPSFKPVFISSIYDLTIDVLDSHFHLVVLDFEVFDY